MEKKKSAQKILSVLLCFTFLFSQTVPAAELTQNPLMDSPFAVTPREGQQNQEPSAAPQIQDPTAEFFEKTLTLTVPEKKENHEELIERDHERYDFEEALDQLRPEYATAVLLKDIHARDLQKLTELKFETALIELDGEIIIFSTGNESEIGTTSPAKALLDKASFVAHVHTKSGGEQGPSPYDLSHANGNTEYVITENNAYAYNANGTNQSLSLEEMAAVISRARDEERQKVGENQVAARVELNKFIREMDLYNQLPQENHEIFRKGVLTVGQGAEYSTISAAFAAAHNGDIIEILSGTYQEGGLYLDKNVTIRGKAGNQVIIDGIDLTSNFATVAQYTPVVIENITFKNFDLNLHHPNMTRDFGGVFYAYWDSKLTINNCIFEDNAVHGAVGGGAIFAWQSELTITNSTFRRHYATKGGAILAAGGKVTLKGSLFENNGVGYQAGVLKLEGNTSTLIEDTVFHQNHSDPGYGPAAIYATDEKNLTLRRVKLTDNAGSNNSGGIRLERSTAVFEYTLFTGNSAYYGAAIVAENSSLDISHATFSGNLNHSFAPGLPLRPDEPIINVSGMGSFKLRDSIIYANPSKAFSLANTITADLGYSLLQESATGQNLIVSADPYFVYPAGNDYRVDFRTPAQMKGNVWGSEGFGPEAGTEVRQLVDQFYYLSCRTNGAQDIDRCNFNGSTGVLSLRGNLINGLQTFWIRAAAENPAVTGNILRITYKSRTLIGDVGIVLNGYPDEQNFGSVNAVLENTHDQSKTVELYLPDDFPSGKINEVYFNIPGNKYIDLEISKIAFVQGRPLAASFRDAALYQFDPSIGMVETNSQFPFEGYSPDLRNWSQPSHIGYYAQMLAGIAAGDFSTYLFTREQAVADLNKLMDSLLSYQSASGFLGLVGWMNYDASTGQWTQRNQDYDPVSGGHHVGPIVAIEDNANLTSALAVTYGTLLDDEVKDKAGVAALRDKVWTFLQNQKEGWGCLAKRSDGFMWGGMAITSGVSSCADFPAGNYLNYGKNLMGDETRNGILTALLLFGDQKWPDNTPVVPKSVYENMGIPIKSYTLQNGKTVETMAPWLGAFHEHWPSLSMPETLNPTFRSILENYADIALDFADKNNLPGFLSASYENHNYDLVYDSNNSKFANQGWYFIRDNMDLRGKTITITYSGLTTRTIGRVEFKKQNGQTLQILGSNIRAFNPGNNQVITVSLPEESDQTSFEDVDQIVLWTDTGNGFETLTVNHLTFPGLSYEARAGICAVAYDNGTPCDEKSTSLYTLGAAHMLRPQEVEDLLRKAFTANPGLMTHHGVWEGVDTHSDTAGLIKEQVASNGLTFILGMIGKSPEHMQRFLDNRGLTDDLHKIKYWDQVSDLDLIALDSNHSPDFFNFGGTTGRSYKYSNQLKARLWTGGKIVIKYNSPQDYNGGFLEIKHSTYPHLIISGLNFKAGNGNELEIEIPFSQGVWNATNIYEINVTIPYSVSSGQMVSLTYFHVDFNELPDPPPGGGAGGGGGGPQAPPSPAVAPLPQSLDLAAEENGDLFFLRPETMAKNKRDGLILNIVRNSSGKIIQLETIDNRYDYVYASNGDLLSIITYDVQRFEKQPAVYHPSAKHLLEYLNGRVQKIYEYRLSEEDRNIVLSMEPQVSSEDRSGQYGSDQFPWHKAVDGIGGDGQIGWVASFDDADPFLKIDLGESKTIHQFRYDNRFPGANANRIWQENFTISGSLDGENWFTLVSVNGATKSDVFNFEFDPTLVRFIKVHDFKIVTDNPDPISAGQLGRPVDAKLITGYVTELEVYEKQTKRELTSVMEFLYTCEGNCATGKAVSVQYRRTNVTDTADKNISQGLVPEVDFNSYNTAYLATNGVYGADWLALNGAGPHWLKLDFGSQKEVSHIVLDSRYRIQENNTGGGLWLKSFDVQGSTDGTNWFSVVKRENLTAGSGQIFEFDVDPVMIRYLKVDNIVTSAGFGFFSEVKVFENTYVPADPQPVVEIVSPLLTNDRNLHALTFRIDGQDIVKDFSAPLVEGENLRSFIFEHGVDVIRMTVQIKLDSAPPVISAFKINKGDEYSGSRQVTLDLNASDRYTGIQLVEYSLDGTNWNAWTDYQHSLSVSFPEDGEKTVTVRVTDKAGNQTQAQDSITIDSTPPQNGSLILNAGDPFTIFTDLRLQVSSTDLTAVTYEASIGGGSWKALNGSDVTLSNFLTAPEGLKTIQIRATDKAGNQSTFSSSIYYGVKPYLDQLPRVQTNIPMLYWTLDYYIKYKGANSKTAKIKKDIDKLATDKQFKPRNMDSIIVDLIALFK